MFEEKLQLPSPVIICDQPAGAIAHTATSAAQHPEKQKSPASAPRNKTRAKKGKGKGKAKPEPPEETDPRKLELIRWVRVGLMTKPFTLMEKRQSGCVAQRIISLSHVLTFS